MTNEQAELNKAILRFFGSAKEEFTADAQVEIKVGRDAYDNLRDALQRVLEAK